VVVACDAVYLAYDCNIFKYESIMIRITSLQFYDIHPHSTMATGITEQGLSMTARLLPAGIYSPAVDDGFYVLLDPLSVGNHALHFHAENPMQNFIQDVTHNKAFDVDLHCPVTLKVINEKYVGDESARLRHSNVASVLHLGRTESIYFYAMEFVEGETLEKLIKRSGRLEARLALEIVTQVVVDWAQFMSRNLSTEISSRRTSRSYAVPATSSVAIASLSLCLAAISAMLTMAIFAFAEKYQNVLLTTCDKEHMPEKSWNLTKPGLGKVLSFRFSAC
jgi:hypothetical protein